MNDTNIIVIAEAEIKDGMVEEVLPQLEALVESTRKEPGCIEYNLHRDLENEKVFMFYEVWESKAHLETHIEQPPLQNLLARQEQWFAGPLTARSYCKVR
ncbi:Putative monooxygenase YcnE [Limihaloglobus sulfuriphilus]|uniref:Putative monooxygenase YcnE n=1 Tax=Limihaloglobus sulfuriphilus TaxID=1851148 RepID=A0A1Q2MCI4_9BACT|nr:putative quinol monooxygenase [Limihaloglobus sulfuriphilus]AQQ70248.1 Putative monooxygenase YcnE [Limihaloglobus sulfuriphilus]